MSALLKWTIFCTVTGRDSRVVDMDTRRYFEVGDREDLSYEQKLAEYRKLADEYFQVDEYTEFCATALAHVDEIVLDWVASPEFDALLIETVKRDLPGARAGGVRRALPRAARPLGARAGPHTAECLTMKAWTLDAFDARARAARRPA